MDVKKTFMVTRFVERGKWLVEIGSQFKMPSKYEDLFSSEFYWEKSSGNDWSYFKKSFDRVSEGVSDTSTET